MHGHARRSGTDRYQQPADNPNDGFVVAVKGNAGQQGELEAVCVERHDKERFGFADRISQMLSLNGYDLRNHADISEHFYDLIQCFHEPFLLKSDLFLRAVSFC